MGQLYTAPFLPGTCVTLAPPDGLNDDVQMQPIDAVVLEYVTRDYIYAYTVAAYWRQAHTQPGWRIFTRIEAHRLSRSNETPAPARRGQVCRRLYWAEGGTPRWGEAIVLAEVHVANTSLVCSNLGDGGPSRALFDIAWRTADGEAWVVEKRVNPTALLPVKPMPKPKAKLA